MNSDVGRQMSGREEREPAGDVLFAEREGLSGEENERIENGAPGDLVIVERIVEMARADGIFGQDQRARVRIPDRESPVADQLAKQSLPQYSYAAATIATSVESSGHKFTQLTNKIGAIVQAAVPGEDGARRGDVRLRFAARFLGRVEGAVEHADASLGIGAGIVWAIRSEKRARPFRDSPGRPACHRNSIFQTGRS